MFLRQITGSSPAQISRLTGCQRTGWAVTRNDEGHVTNTNLHGCRAEDRHGMIETARVGGGRPDAATWRATDR
jgi:hypothetical protein